MKHVTVMLVTLLWATAHAAVSDRAQNRDGSKDWLADAGYGVFVHYLGGGPDWNDRVNSFDVGRFADQVAQTGAAYLVFTLGQNSGYYCSPNATYEKYAGYQSGQRCSRRDLPMEIADALGKKGIRLMLYLPSRSPQQDEQAMANLNDVNEQQPAPQEFTRKWSEVIREWSLRYGREGLRLVVRRLLQQGRVGRSVEALQLEHLGGGRAHRQSRQYHRLQSRRRHPARLQQAHGPAGLHRRRAERVRRDPAIQPGPGRPAMAPAVLPRHPMGQGRRASQERRLDDRIPPQGQRPGGHRHDGHPLLARRQDL